MKTRFSNSVFWLGMTVAIINDTAAGVRIVMIDKDAQQAVIARYIDLAEQGNTEAQHHLGVVHFCGETVPQDFEQAFDWFTIAAKQGYTKSQCTLSENDIAVYR